MSESFSSEDTREVELTTYVVAQIVKRIIEGRAAGLTDKVIDSGIEKDIGPLCYWQCECIDASIFEDKERGYWRAAHGYPKDGDFVMCPMSDGQKAMVAENCGFFTFGMKEMEEDR